MPEEEIGAPEQPMPDTLAVDTGPPPAPPAPPTFPLLVAKQNIPIHTQVTAAMVEVQQVDTPVANAFTEPGQLTEHVSTEFIPTGTAIMPDLLHEGLYNVLAARIDIPANTILTEDMLQTLSKEVDPPESIPADQQATILRGGVTRVAIKSGELLTPSALYGMEASKPELAYMIPIYKRAITIAAKTPDMVNNFMIRQGNEVDVIAKFDESYAGVDVSRTIVTSAEVLMLNQSLQGLPTVVNEQGVPVQVNNFQWVTLAVTPREAEKLTFAVNHATELRLTLRSPTLRSATTQVNTTREIILGDGFGRPHAVEIYNRGVGTIHTVEEY